MRIRRDRFREVLDFDLIFRSGARASFRHTIEGGTAEDVNKRVAHVLKIVLDLQGDRVVLGTTAISLADVSYVSIRRGK